MALNVEPALSCECTSADKESGKDVVRKILDKYRNGSTALISILEDIQAEFGYLPSDALTLVAHETGASLVDIYGIATFYRSFSLKPRGKHVVSVCLGTACHVRGGPSVASEFEHQLGIKAGETTADREFSLETVNCLGACALGPIVVVDNHYFSHVTKSKVKQILRRVEAGLDKVDVKSDKRIIHLEVICPHCSHSLMDPEHPLDDYPSIRTEASFNGTRGWVRLSSLYGSYTTESEHEPPVGTDVDFYCPHCRARLTTDATCPLCGSPMASMKVKGNGIVLACSQRGCKGHALYLTGIIPE